MQIYDVPALADAAVSAKPDRAATAIVHDSDDARVVVFRLDPRQIVALHSSDSSVMLSVVRGPGYVSGLIDGAVSEIAVSSGAVVAYQPNEPHGMRAGPNVLVIVATIAPRPGLARASQVA